MRVEAETMAFLRDQGYPVPAIEELSQDGTELAMERVDGPSMLGWLSRRPWTVRAQGGILADLHHRLHAIGPPPFLPAAPVGAGGEDFLHLDLHPLNIIISSTGPVVIDWSNAARGQAAIDAALAWVLMAAGEVPAGRLTGRLLGAFRGLLVNSFLDHFERDSLVGALKEVVAWKVRDPHMAPNEQQAMWRLVKKETTDDSG
jgi:aminoglycoside phosphotransferase (APT) family kinase protein